MEKHFLLKVFILCFICAVFAANHHIEKRDHHRIILKERRPRSHKSHTHHRHHKHHHRDLGKPGKHHGKYSSSYDHDFSFEDFTKYRDSRDENSFEETRYKSRHHRKPAKRPQYSSVEYEDLKSESQREEWNPLYSSETGVLHSSSDIFDDYSPSLRRKPRRENKRYSSSHLDIEITTKYPTTSPFYSSYHTAFPTFSGFSQKNIDLKHPTPPFLRSQHYRVNNTSYEVHENNKDLYNYEDFLQKQNFEVLAPTLELNNNRDLTAEANNMENMGTGEENIHHFRKINGRKRGRRLKIRPQI